MKKSTIEIFFEYLNTADIVYKNNVCITDMNTRKHRYDIIPSDIEKVCINPNHTFTVWFDNDEKDVFELYTTKGHYYPTDDICL